MNRFLLRNNLIYLSQVHLSKNYHCFLGEFIKPTMKLTWWNTLYRFPLQLTCRWCGRQKQICMSISANRYFWTIAIKMGDVGMHPTLAFVDQVQMELSSTMDMQEHLTTIRWKTELCGKFLLKYNYCKYNFKISLS